MKIKNLILLLLVTAGLQAVSAQTGAAPDTTRRIALLGAKNLSGDPRADYLGGILQGLLSYDLSRTAGIILVDRASLDKVLAETELQLSGIVDDKGASAKLGSLLGANYLLFIEYAMLSGEVLVTAKSVDVGTGRQGSFVERGATENVLHRLAESIAEYFTGLRPSFADPASERSILTLRDESPGTIALHSIMSHAEIYLDGEFAGYTTGNSEIPFVMEKLKPGKHLVRVRGDHGFGIVVLPAILFKDWELEVNVQPGKRHVIRDETRSFNSILYKLQYIVQKSVAYEQNKPIPPFTAKYNTRDGKPVTVLLELIPDAGSGSLQFKAVLKVNDQVKFWTITPVAETETEFKDEFSGIRLELDIDARYFGKLSIDVTLLRTDVWQGMFDDE